MHLTLEELRALIIALELESFTCGFAFKHQFLLIKLKDLEFVESRRGISEELPGKQKALDEQISNAENTLVYLKMKKIMEQEKTPIQGG